MHWLARCAADRIEKLIGSLIPGLGGRLALPGKKPFSGVPKAMPLSAPPRPRLSVDARLTNVAPQPIVTGVEVGPAKGRRATSALKQKPFQAHEKQGCRATARLSEDSRSPRPTAAY